VSSEGAVGTDIRNDQKATGINDQNAVEIQGRIARGVDRHATIGERLFRGFPTRAGEPKRTLLSNRAWYNEVIATIIVEKPARMSSTKDIEIK